MPLIFKILLFYDPLRKYAVSNLTCYLLSSETKTWRKHKMHSQALCQASWGGGVGRNTAKKKTLPSKGFQSHSDTCRHFHHWTEWEEGYRADTRAVLRSAAACQVFTGVMNIDRIDSHIFLGISSPPPPFPRCLKFLGTKPFTPFLNELR